MTDIPDGPSVLQTWLTAAASAGLVIGTAVYIFFKQVFSNRDSNGSRSVHPSRYVVEAASLSDSRPLDKIAELLGRVTEEISESIAILRRIEENTSVSRASDVELLAIMRERMRLEDIKREAERLVRERRSEVEEQAQGRRNHKGPSQ